MGNGPISRACLGCRSAMQSLSCWPAATTDLLSHEGHPGGIVVKAVFERALADAVTLLRELPRHRHAERAARSRFEQFKAAHAGLLCRLLVHTKPGSENLDFDILLTIQ